MCRQSQCHVPPTRYTVKPECEMFRTEQLLCCTALLDEVLFPPFLPASFQLSSFLAPVVRPLVSGSHTRSGVLLVHVLKHEYR